MKQANFYIRFGLLLLVLTIITSCNGQEKRNVSRNIQLIKSPPTVPVPNAEPNSKISEYIRNTFQDKNGHLWFGTNGDGVVHYDGEQLSYYSNKQGFRGGQVTGMTEDLDGNIWFATDQGIVKYDFSTSENGEKKFTNHTDPENFKGKQVWSIFSDSKGTLWVGTSVGAYRFDGNTLNSFVLPQMEGPESGFITNRTIWSISEDQKGNIWFGTNGYGAFKYGPINDITPDIIILTQYTKKDGLTDDSVDIIIEDKKGNIWFGTRYGGVSRYDGETFTNYTSNDSIGNNEVCILFEDKAGNIWFSSEGYGVYRYTSHADTGEESFTNFSFDQGLGVRAVQTIFEDNEGRFWVGGGGGLYRYDKEAEKTGGKAFFHVARNGPWEK